MARITRTQRLLEAIRDSGGMTTSQIQEWLCRELGYDWSEPENIGVSDPSVPGGWRRDGTTVGTKRRNRGIWSSNLFCTYSRGGLLYRFCRKVGRRWTIAREITGPFYSYAVPYVDGRTTTYRGSPLRGHFPPKS